MLINGVVRGDIDRRVTLLKRVRDRLENTAKGDILLLKVNGIILIRKVLEDFIISLPRSLSLKTNSKIKIEILKHIKPSVGLERSNDAFVEDLADLRHFIPLKTVHGKNIFIIDDSDDIFIWFPHGGRLKFARVKRFVEKEKLFELMGFLWGDGSTEGVRSIRLTNGEPSTLVNCIEFFESIGISRSIWKVQIIRNSKEPPTESAQNECKNFWSNRLKLPLENIKSVLWNKGKGEQKEFGCARIFIDNAVLFELFVNGILKWSKKEIERDNPDEIILKGLLRGIIAAESDVQTRDGVISRIGFSFDSNSDEGELFSTILVKLGFIISEPINKKECRFSIDGWRNFSRFFLMDAFRFHEKKSRTFIQGFLNHTFTKSRIDKLILFDKGLRQFEIANKLGVSRECISSMCKTMVKGGLILKKLDNRFELTSLSKDLINKISLST